MQPSKSSGGRHLHVALGSVLARPCRRRIRVCLRQGTKGEIGVPEGFLSDVVVCGFEALSTGAGAAIYTR